MRKKGPGLDWAKVGERDKKNNTVTIRQDLKKVFRFKDVFLLFFLLKPPLMNSLKGVAPANPGSGPGQEQGTRYSN